MRAWARARTHADIYTMIDDWYNSAFYVNVKRLGLWIFCSRCHYISFGSLFCFVIHFLCFTLSLSHSQFITAAAATHQHALLFQQKLHRTYVIPFFSLSFANRSTDKVEWCTYIYIYECVRTCVCVLMLCIVIWWKAFVSRKRNQVQTKTETKIQSEKDPAENSHRCHWQSYFIIVIYTCVDGIICTQLVKHVWSMGMRQHGGWR